MQQAVTGTLRVAAFPTAARAVMPPVMTALSRLHPELRVTLRDLEADESLTALANDEIDIAIVDDYGDGSRVTDPGARGLRVHARPRSTSPRRREWRDVARLGRRECRPRCHRRGLSNSARPPPAGEARLEEFRDAFWIMDTDNSHLSGDVSAGLSWAGGPKNGYAATIEKTR
jgi:DNA-binding transcriptional LysR family regulator